MFLLNCHRHNVVTYWALSREKVWGHPLSEPGIYSVCGDTWPVNAPLTQGTVESQWCPGCLWYLAEGITTVSQDTNSEWHGSSPWHHHVTHLHYNERGTDTHRHPPLNCTVCTFILAWPEYSNEYYSVINNQLIARAKNTSCINSQQIVMLNAHSTSKQN